jgi:uncharacterized protein (TIGR02147 family)
MDAFSESENSANALHRVIFASGKKQSVRQISKKLGFASDRSLGMVLSGQRIPTPDLIHKVAKKYHVGSNGLLLLNLLAQRDRLKLKNSPTQDLDEEIRKVRPLSVRYRTLTTSQLQTLQSWACFPTLEILRQAQTPLSINEIETRLRKSPPVEELTQILRSMASMGLLERHPKDLYSARPDGDYFLSSQDFPSAAIRRIHRQQLLRAADSLDEESVFEREFITKTLTIPADRISEAKELLRQAFEELSQKLVNLKIGDESVVIQFGGHLFRQSLPLAKIPSPPSWKIPEPK